MATVISGALPSWAKGYGYGYGYGYGDGSGDGYGYGYGYGYGSGSGDGYGSGYGDGYGYGYGDGLKEATIGFISMLPKERQTRVKALIKDGAKLAYWKSNKDGKPANGGKSDPVHVGLVQTVAGPLNLCQPGTLHATYRLDKWKGHRIWLVALSGEVKETEDKLGALQREFLAELTGGKIQ